MRRLRAGALSNGSSVSSNGTMASAPSGTGAPVMIRTAVPAVTSPSNTEPAATSPGPRAGTRSAPARSDVLDVRPAGFCGSAPRIAEDAVLRQDVDSLVEEPLNARGEVA